jgi:hypothetical protein
VQRTTSVPNPFPPAAATEVLSHAAAARLDTEVESGDFDNPGSGVGGGIDKSVLAISEPRRHCDKAHRKFFCRKPASSVGAIVLAPLAGAAEYIIGRESNERDRAGHRPAGDDAGRGSVGDDSNPPQWLARAVTDMQHPHNPGALVDRKNDPVDVRLFAEQQTPAASLLH